MKILYLVGTDPRSTSYGGEQRTHFIWESLKKVGEVYTVIPVAHAYQEKVDEADRIRWVCFEKRWTPGWLLRRLLARRFPRIGLPCGYDIKKFITRYTFVFDKCVVRYVTMASFLKAWKIAPMILDVDDLLTEEHDSRHPSRTLWAGMHRKVLECYQTLVFERARHLWVSNYSHQALLAPYPVSYLPNIPVQIESVAEDISPNAVLLFVGLLSCDQNYLGIDYFLKTYWTELHQCFPSLLFRIVGGGLPDAFKKHWRAYPNVIQLGFVEDLHALYQESMCVVAPLYCGSGTSIKVLEALNAGRVCLATHRAARGVPERDRVPSNGLLVFESLLELISGLCLLKNEDTRLTLQRGAHAYVQKHFTAGAVDDAVRAVVDGGLV